MGYAWTDSQWSIGQSMNCQTLIMTVSFGLFGVISVQY